MGVIVDRTKSRFGKARPWLLRMCIPFAVSGILLFSVPSTWAATPKLVYVFITYNLVSTVIYTAINVPYSALNALMTQDPYERSVLSIFRNLLATAGTLTINTCTLPLVEYFGDNAPAWTKTFCVFGLLAVAAFLINFFGTKERVKPAGAENGKAADVPFATGIKALFKNKYWIMMTGMLALFFLMYSVNGGATVYYAKEILYYDNMNYINLRKYYSETLGQSALSIIQLENGEKTEFLNTRIPVDEKPLFLRLNIQGRRSWFEWSYDNEHYEAIGKVFDTTRFSDEYCKYGEFTGTMVGITCADRVKHTHYADFDFFEYIADETKPVE